MGNHLNDQVQKMLALPPLSQIGIVVKDLSKALPFYANIWKIGPFKIFEPEYTEMTYRGKPGNFRIRAAIAPSGPIDIELIEPLSGQSVHADFLKDHGDGLHHLGFVVDRLAERVESMGKMGIEVLTGGKRPGVTWVYLDTESLTGFPIELIERKK